MSWNPKSSIALFEPGSILCVYCGWKPDDCWDTSPDGINYIGGEWICTECQAKHAEEDAAEQRAVNEEQKRLAAELFTAPKADPIFDLANAVIRTGMTPKQRYAGLESLRLRKCAERAAVAPLNNDDHAAYEYMGELDAEIEEIEAQQDAIAADIDHLVNGPSMGGDE